MLILFFSLLAYAVLMFSLTLNPVEVSLWLMLIFALLALFTFFFQFEFLGILLVVLYVSALIVLFIYIILLLPPTKILSKKLLDNLGMFFFFVFLIVASYWNMEFVVNSLPWLLTKFWLSNSFLFLHAIMPAQLLILGLSIFLSHSFTFLLLGLIFFFSLFWVLLVLQQRV